MQDDAPLVDRVVLSFAETKHYKLLAWAATLPTDLGNNADGTAHVYPFQYKPL